MIARDRRLSASLLSILQALESMEPGIPISAIEPVIRRELGDSEASGIALSPEVLAEASVAVVVPFATHSSQGRGDGDGVLKVLKPGIEETLAEELELWNRLAAFVDERCEHYGVPTLRYAETLETIRDLLTNEIRLAREQQHLAWAASLYADTETVHIPAVLPFCTPRITAMERIYGRKVTDTVQLSDAARRELASEVMEALIARPVWASDSSSIFHADPHAGNLIFTEQGRLAILDWALVGSLEKPERIQTVQIMLGALTFDARRIADAMARMAISPPHESALRGVVLRALDRLLPATLPGFRWLITLMDDAMLSAGVRFKPELLLFRKSILTIEGVVADISADMTFDHVLPVSGARQFLRESIGRAVASPVSRHFGTHLSNLDLLSVCWGMPASVARFWMHSWDQWLRQACGLMRIL